MLGTPVVTHTSVVFVRLHWFEKHLRNTVQLSRSRSQRPSRSRSRISNDKERSSRGVDGRTIVVFRSNNQLHNQQASKNEYKKASEDTEKLAVPSERTATEQLEVKFPSFNSTTLPSAYSHTHISNGLELGQDEIPDSPHKVIAQQRSLDRHIAIEEQRHPKDDMPLRIFGPRENLQSDEGSFQEHIHITESEKQLANAGEGMQNTSNDPGMYHLGETHQMPQNTTFAESFPSAIRHRSQSKLRRDVRQSSSRDRDAASYLSWQPTIGRNSAFVDLTADQKDELGGIEYRSLKTLSWVLICKFYPTTTHAPGPDIIVKSQ